MKINIFWSITFYIKGNEKYGTGSSPIIVDSVLGRYSHTYTSLTMEKQKCCNIFCTTDAKTFLVLCVVAKSIFMKTKNPLFLIDPMVNMRVYTKSYAYVCAYFITNSQICRLGVRLF